MQLSILAIQPGSFDITLAFKKENTPPIKDIPSIQGDTVSEFLNLLRSKDSESDLKAILKRLQSRVSEEYKKLLTSLSESGQIQHSHGHHQSQMNKRQYLYQKMKYLNS